MAGQSLRGACVCLPVTAKHTVACWRYPHRAPALVVGTGGAVITLTMPAPPGAAQVEFARALAREAASYAIEVERRWRGLAPLPASPSTHEERRTA